MFTLSALSECGGIRAQHVSHAKHAFIFHNYLHGAKCALPVEPVYRAKRLRRTKRTTLDL